MENLIDLQVKTLFKKFGEGKHKPGSGSAAALTGMLGAEMIKTVIDLTKGKATYKHLLKDLDIILKEVEDDIYPALTKLIQEDSIQFGKAIEARKIRNAEEDIELKSIHANGALQELKIATEIPVSIAKYCIRLAEIGIYLFDNCFQSARGDSSVAINNALSAVSGCIAIINLNLLSFGNNEWTNKMRGEADDIKKLRDKLLLEEDDRQESLKEEAKQMHQFFIDINEFQNGLQLNNRVTYDQIEKLVSNIQNSMWKYKDCIWKKNIPETPFEIIDSIKLLKKLGYQYQQKSVLESFETNEGVYQTAGVIDTQNKHVSISENFTPETIAFTIAHELGHAILHPGLVLHRDRPMDGSSASGVLDFKELQANKFASCFLMPRKLVTKQFGGFFSTSKIELNTSTALSLGMRITDLRAMCNSVRDLSRIIATAELYGARSFPSIANQFDVSAETMAIRLEELGLVSL
jgi:formiminotetrahydrofolate cyclodeaminase/Zn-dependent peptidase ImmA (M78 family)